VKLTIVGCSGSIPGPDSPASCYLVEHDGFRIVMDLGHGSLGALQRYIALTQIDAVVLSHLHAPVRQSGFRWPHCRVRSGGDC
jgi:ribonuclease BN (tRNA processing enzyme)